MKITRSYSQKLNLGNYQTADFFCMVEEEIGDINERERTSMELSTFCRAKVEEDINEYKQEQEDKKPKEKQDVVIRKEIQLP